MTKLTDLTKAIAEGMTGQDVISAVQKSGFPLQTVIADQLSSSFQIQEEWAFKDVDSQEIRTLDIFAKKDFWTKEEEQPHIRPELNLLIECKKSETPYVFFLSPNRSYVSDFPIISGLHHDFIALKTDDDRSTYQYSIIRCLGLESHPFFSNDIPSAMTFSKCIRNGTKVELNGDEPFRSLVLPLIKGMRHFKKAATPPDTAMYFDCGITLGIALIDAPLLGVSSKDNEINSLDWVRVFRRTSEDAKHSSERFRCFAIDVIHKDFLNTYLDKNLLPFMNVFSKLAIKHEKEISAGKGFASGLGRSRLDIESRLRSR